MELSQYLSMMRDPAGVPFYPIVFQVLMVLTFCLHILVVNIVVGGSFLALWMRLKGTAESLRLSAALARSNTVGVSVAMVLGVAPLLFVQVIYDPFWYTANTMSAYWALGFLLAIAVAFTCAYIFYLKKDKEKGSNPVWAALSLAGLLVSAFIIHGLSVEQLYPQKWKDWIVAGDSVITHGKGLYLIEPARLLHFIVPSFAVTGVYLMLYAWFFKERKDYQPSYLRFVGELGAKLALYFTVAQVVVGFWWLLTLPHDLFFLSNPFLLLGAGAGLGLLGLLMTSQKDPSENAIKCAIGVLVTVFLMSYAREALRMVYVAKVGYSIFDYKLAVDWGSAVLFFGTFIGGLVVMAYPVLVAVNLARNGSDKNHPHGLGRLAAALPVLWFVLVAGLGIIISLKNGTLF